MEFEIMGETENWLALEKDHEGVEFKGNFKIFLNYLLNICTNYYI